jgi:hypothetical protein
MFNYNSIYYLRYMPKGYGHLHIFDSLPLVLPLYVMGPTMLALNLHWVPSPLRVKFVLFISNIYSRGDDNWKARFHIWYQTIKNSPNLAFTLMAVRRYYIARCSNIIEIPGDQWGDLPLLSNTKYRARYLRMTASQGNVIH